MERSKRPTNNHKVIIFLDGSNFYHRLKDKELGLDNFLQFSYKEFGEWLAQGRSIVECIYYIGLVRREKGNQKSEKLVKNQQRLFAHLKKECWQIETGFMMKHGKNNYKEKGVDVRLAIDILDKAYLNEYDTAIVVSSDTDLIPAIERARKLGKKIEYVGFSHRPSFGMQNHATLSRLLTKFDLKKFMPDDKMKGDK